MSGKRTGGVVVRGGDDGPPTIENWRAVDDGEAGSFDHVGDTGDGRIAYRTTVADPRTGTDEERVMLRLQAAGAAAEVWLNGDRIGTRTPAFAPFRHTFDPDPENELVVVCEPTEPSFWGPDDDGGSTERAGTVAPPTLEIDARPTTLLWRLEAQPRLTDAGGVIDLEVTVDAAEPVDDTITVSVRPGGSHGGGTMQRLSVRADAGERVTVSDTVELREPSLWWPREYGPQHRYAVRAKLGGDAVSEPVAFRQIDRDDEGLVVNGRRIRARGLTRRVGGKPKADVERLCEANATLVRAREHVPSATFYEACDRAGLLVWQDLPSGGPEEDCREFARAIERVHGHRPSLGLYGVAGDSSAPIDGLHGSGTLTKLRYRYRLWRAQGDRDGLSTSVTEAVADRRPIVSSTGPPGTDADGTVLFPGWRYLAASDVDWLLERDPSLGTVVAGFGAGSLAREDVDPADVPGLDAATLAARLEAFGGSEGDADVDDSAVDTSQRYHAETLETVAEALRRHGTPIMTAATLRDLAPGGGMGVLSADGDEKPAYRALADAFEPVQAVLDEPPTAGSSGVEITLCNDTHETHEATVAWQAGDAASETTVSVDPLETTAAGTAEIPDDAAAVELTVQLDERTVTNRYSL